jgi:hypothetical protein
MKIPPPCPVSVLAVASPSSIVTPEIEAVNELLTTRTLAPFPFKMTVLPGLVGCDRIPRSRW